MLEVERQRTQIVQYESDLGITKWYIKFMEDGRDIKKILEDHDLALVKVDELEHTLQFKTYQYEAQIRELTTQLAESKATIERQ